MSEPILVTGPEGDELLKVLASVADRVEARLAAAADDVDGPVVA